VNDERRSADFVYVSCRDDFYGNRTEQKTAETGRVFENKTFASL
jgi:hypothetical protein